MISVVIPLYNKAHTIIHTLTTVLNQTFRDFEIIIVNDGSTDGGVEKISNYTKDKRIKIFNKANEGVSIARNYGVEKATYEYIAFLDADDEYLPDYLKNVYEVIKKYPNAKIIAFAGFIKNFITGEITPRVAKKYIDKTIITDYFEAPDVFSHTSATVVNKSAFIDCGGFPPGVRAMEDFYLCYKMGLEGEFVYCGKLLSVYVGGVEGQTTSGDAELRFEHIKDELYVFNNIYDYWLKKNKSNEKFIQFIKYKLRHIFLCNLKNNDYKRIEFYINGFSEEIKNELGENAIKLYSIKKLKLIAIAQILFTKLFWRLHKYPRVGELKGFYKTNDLIKRYHL